MHKHSKCGTLFPAFLCQDLFTLSLPQQSCQWVSVQISFKWFHWFLNFVGRLDFGRRIRIQIVGTVILLIPITLARLPFSLECKLILHHLLVLRIQEVWKSENPCVTRRIPARCTLHASPAPADADQPPPDPLADTAGEDSTQFAGRDLTRITSRHPTMISYAF